MKKDTILVIGAGGQLGTELSQALQKKYGQNQIISSDVRQLTEFDGITETLDATNAQAIANLVDKYKITQIYHLAAILSAKGEQVPMTTWNINMSALLNVLEVGREKKLDKIYYPSSIAVFGDDTPKINTPQDALLSPQTVYGISKQAGENWCRYYFERYGLDVRSLRYPGLISYKTLPGGGTTDYAVDIYIKALESNHYECFLTENTYLPMMYMPDAVRATLELMEAESEKISIRTSYNLGGMSFSPKEITKEIQRILPDFTINYKPDSRQKIADSWSDSIDDQVATADWGWKDKFNLKTMSEDMLLNLKK
jgi:nucleoside-diphosphate-sugar epimerase